MAQNQVSNQLMVTDRRASAAGAGGYATNLYSSTFATNTSNVTAARARLTAISGTTYTAAVLDKMTLNDMIYAIRLNDEAASI